MNHFFAYLYRLRFIRRWSLMRNAVPESVALLAHARCAIGRVVFGRDVPTERVVTLALYHDAEEVTTSAGSSTSSFARGWRSVLVGRPGA